MAAKRILMVCALAMIFGSMGCQHWCERHYPCPQQCAAPAYAAPAYVQPTCQPCNQQPVSYAPQAWNNPPTDCSRCTCVQR